MEKLFYIYSMVCPGTVKKGSADTVSVKAIKLRLNDLMGSKLDPTNGNFGDSTELVVKQFQRSRNLRDDGEVGTLTWERLFTITVANPIESPVLRVRAEQILFTQLHVRELTGNNDGADVEKYLKAVGLGKGYAWCVAIQYWAFLQAAEQLKIKNLMPKTAGVLDCLKKSKIYVLDLKKDKPKAGDIGCMDFGGGKGHMFMVTANRDTHVFTIEGNTSADPTYKAMDREGNGVFERNRAISSVKGFIRYE